MKFLCVLLLFFSLEGFIPIPGSNAVPMTPEELEKTKQFLKKFPPDQHNYTYHQLRTWIQYGWDRSRVPTLFPFCMVSKDVAATTDASSNCGKFGKVLEKIEAKVDVLPNFNKDNHLMTKNTKWIKEIKLSRINTPEMDMVNLRNWIHITVVTQEPLEGLLIQAITGPLGIPMGEFNVDFPCKDMPESTTIDVVGQLCYCSLRPRVTSQHPNVYAGIAKSPRTEFHVHYSYTDLQCLETYYLQFTLIAVKKFPGHVQGVDFQPLFSQIYLNSKLDGLSGAPYPYYPEWRDSMYCNLDSASMESTYKSNYPMTTPNGQTLWVSGYPSVKKDADAKFAPIHWTPVPDMDTILNHNLDYFPCLFNDKHPGRDSKRLECPPGPLKCDEPGGGVGTEADMDKNQARMEYLKGSTPGTSCDNLDCEPPLCKTLDLDPKWKFCAGASNANTSGNSNAPTAKDYEAFGFIFTSHRLDRRTSHALIANFGFLVLLPIANFLGRFYKDLPIRCMCGSGPWIAAHIILPIVSLVLVWISIGPVMPQLFLPKLIDKECDFTFNDDSLNSACKIRLSGRNPHVSLALLAFVLFHFLIISGFYRSSNKRPRRVQEIIHTLGGYFCWLIGALSVIAASLYDSCHDMKLTGISMIVIPLLFTIAAQILDVVQDLILNMKQRRYLWPVLEPIEVFKMGPMSKVKLAVLAVYCVLMLIFWVISVASYIVMIDSFKALEGKESTIYGLYGRAQVCQPTSPW